MTITRENLYGFSETRLQEYVRDRLQGLRADPPYVAGRGENPEDFIIAAYEASDDEAFLERMRQAVLKTFKDQDPQAVEPIFFSRLLFLIRFMEIHEAKDRLTELLAQKQCFAGKPSSRRRDLYIDVIQSAAKFKKDEDYLAAMVELLNERDYAPAAYNAICEMSAKLAAIHLADYAKAVKDRDVFMREKLEDLAKIYGAERFHGLWIPRRRNVNDETRKWIEDIMYDIPEFESFRRKKLGENPHSPCSTILFQPPEKKAA